MKDIIKIVLQMKIDLHKYFSGMMKGSLMFLVLMVFGYHAVGQTNTEGLISSKDGIFNITSFGAVGDSLTDNTEAFQKAINAASIKGGVVFVPVGNFLVKGSLNIACGVSVVGVNQSPQSWDKLGGSVVMSTGGRDDENAPSLFCMKSGTAVKGITVYYPEQNVDDIHAYPYTFHINGTKELEAFDCTIENITLINSYNGIHVGPNENGRHRINSVFGTVLRRGIFVESVGDIGRIENVQFHCHFWGNPVTKGDFWKVFKYMQNYCEAFIIGRSDWEYMTNTFVFPARIGYHFIRTENGNWSGACNGQFSGIAADATGCCIKVDAIQNMGLLITNGQFNSHMAGDSCQIVISEKNDGNVRFVNCGFWGPVKHNALIKGNGYVSFSDCYFSSNYYNPSFYSIVAEGGKIQIQNSTFDAAMSNNSKTEKWTYYGDKTMPPCVLIKKGTKQAIVRGNNGCYGVKITNMIGKSAIIESNEPEHKMDTK
jgi:hypothetical protein